MRIKLADTFEGALPLLTEIALDGWRGEAVVDEGGAWWFEGDPPNVKRVTLADDRERRTREYRIEGVELLSVKFEPTAPAEPPGPIVPDVKVSIPNDRIPPVPLAVELLPVPPAGWAYEFLSTGPIPVAKLVPVAENLGAPPWVTFDEVARACHDADDCPPVTVVQTDAVLRRLGGIVAHRPAPHGPPIARDVGEAADTVVAGLRAIPAVDVWVDHGPSSEGFARLVPDLPPGGALVPFTTLMELENAVRRVVVAHGQVLDEAERVAHLDRANLGPCSPEVRIATLGHLVKEARASRDELATQRDEGLRAVAALTAARDEARAGEDNLTAEIAQLRDVNAKIRGELDELRRVILAELSDDDRHRAAMHTTPVLVERLARDLAEFGRVIRGAFRSIAPDLPLVDLAVIVADDVKAAGPTLAENARLRQADRERAAAYATAERVIVEVREALAVALPDRAEDGTLADRVRTLAADLTAAQVDSAVLGSITRNVRQPELFHGPVPNLPIEDLVSMLVDDAKAADQKLAEIRRVSDALIAAGYGDDEGDPDEWGEAVVDALHDLAERAAEIARVRKIIDAVKARSPAAAVEAILLDGEDDPAWVDGVCEIVGELMEFRRGLTTGTISRLGAIARAALRLHLALHLPADPSHLSDPVARAAVDLEYLLSDATGVARGDLDEHALDALVKEEVDCGKF